MKNHVFITYRHLRRDTDTSNAGGVTFAIQADLRNPDNRHVKFSYAMCSPKDNFNKAIGRDMAYKRLAIDRKYDIAIEIPYTSKKNGSIVSHILTYIHDHPEDFDELVRYMDKYVF